MSAEQETQNCRAFHAVQVFYLLSHIILSPAARIFEKPLSFSCMFYYNRVQMSFFVFFD